MTKGGLCFGEIALGRYTEENLLRKISDNAGDESRALIATATDLFAKQDWAQLFQLAQDWTRENADSPDAHYLYGVARFKRRSVKEAIASLQKCLEIKPEHTGALDQLGVIICQQRSAADALPLHQKATSLDPQNSNLWFNLGVAYSRNGDDPNSEKAFRKARKLAGQNKPLSGDCSRR